MNEVVCANRILGLKPYFGYFSVINYSTENELLPVFSEGFEAPGYENSWTVLGTPNDQFTGAVNSGSYSWLGSGGEYAQTTIDDSDYIRVDLWFRTTGLLPGSIDSVFGIRDSSASAIAICRLNSLGQISVYTDGSDSDFTTDSLSINTSYFIRLIFTDSGTTSVEFSTTNTFLGSGSKYTSKIGGSTSDATRLRLRHTSGRDYIFDDIKIYNG